MGREQWERDRTIKPSRFGYIIMPPSNHDGRADHAYSAKDCQWRDKPLSQDDPLEMQVDSPWPCMSAEWNTWVEGGRRYQPELPVRPPGTWWDESDMETMST
jgi:hypothetical protein